MRVVILAAAVFVVAPRLSAQSGDLPVDFDARARRAWLNAPAPTFPDSIATLAGLRFQAVADRRTPDLDSALAQAVMAGGRLRESPWGWLAAAWQRQGTPSRCQPVDQVTIEDLNMRCRTVYRWLRNALERDSAFAPAIVALEHSAPWPELWDAPERELQRVTLALARDGLPPTTAEELRRLRSLLLLDLAPERLSAAVLSDTAATGMTSGERWYARARRWASWGDGGRGMVAYLAGEAVPVSVSVSVVPRGEDGGAAEPAVSVTFVERPPVARAFRTQRVGVASLARGAYDLVVQATLPEGQVVERRQRIVVR